MSGWDLASFSRKDGKRLARSIARGKIANDEEYRVLSDAFADGDSPLEMLPDAGELLDRYLLGRRPLNKP